MEALTQLVVVMSFLGIGPIVLHAGGHIMAWWASFTRRSRH